MLRSRLVEPGPGCLPWLCRVKRPGLELRRLKLKVSLEPPVLWKKMDF